MTAARVDFYLDAGCPWTWLTSRWLVDVTEQRGLEVRWLPFSLALLNEGRPLPAAFDTPELRERLVTSGRALNMITALGDAGDHDGAGRFYTDFGPRFHDRVEPGRGDPAEAAADWVGVPTEVRDAASSNDTRSSISTGLTDALARAGPDIGSPVLRFPPAERGVHGPILGTRVTGAAATRIFDALATLQAAAQFFEIKRGRTGPPQLGTGR